MKFSRNFIKTKREVSSEIESINGTLLTKGGFIHQELAGIYTFMPLGIRVLNKIENIIRKHMDEISSEIVMTSLHPKESWEKTGRLESVDVLMKATGANEKSIKRNDAMYVLGSTHEEIITPLVKDYVQSYKDLPVALYQIQSKFRNEPRAKSGVLRCREFKMKDLYSFHRSEADLLEFYEVVKQKYFDIFAELGLGDCTYLTFASGGDFTTEFSHEFQAMLETGEDTIYLDEKTSIAYNKEVVNDENAQKLGVDFSMMKVIKASEVGNIFPLNTKFSKAFDFNYVDEQGKENLVYMGCYGIGSSRLMGVIVEKFHDDRGIIWPEKIAPFKYHMITDADPEAIKRAEEVYANFEGDILWDDRADRTMGEKFADADLIGCPMRLVVSKRSLDSGGIEYKERASSESRIITDIESV